MNNKLVMSIVSVFTLATVSLAGTLPLPVEGPAYQTTQDLREFGESGIEQCFTIYYDDESWSHVKAQEGMWLLLVGDILHSRVGEPWALAVMTGDGMEIGSISDPAMNAIAQVIYDLNLRFVAIPVDPPLGLFFDVDVKPKTNCQVNKDPNMPPCSSPAKDCVCIYIVVPS